MAEGGIQTVTGAKAGSMARQIRESSSSSSQKLDGHSALPLPSSRPELMSQHSSSVPSTPYAHARKLSDEYRTPSPMNRGPEAPSPRSSRSESDTTVRSAGGRASFLATSTAGCKYETGMAHYRRRIPYSVGGELLDLQTKVKKALDPADEEKLSGDMRELYNRLMPSADSDLRRKKLVAKLESILNEKWPGNNIKVHVFGSSGNLLCSNDSDVDICITTTMKALEKMCVLAKTLAEHGMERVVCVPHAKVPIVKIWDPELQLACDMNVNNTLALENTRMVKTYVQIDPRVRPLAMVIKHWTRRRILNDAALGGTLSSYTWICLIINFLQTRKPKVLPTLQQRPHQCLKDENGNLSSFADDLESLTGFGSPNKETIGQLLFHFFRKYAYELDYEKNVVSVRAGAYISKKDKGWHLMQNNRLCVEEPFNTDRNLGNTADDISFRGVHLELRRAFGHISQGKLTEACEQYEFPEFPEHPVGEDKSLFTKPGSQPRPVLTRSLSQQGRKGGSTQASNNNRNVSGPKNRNSQGGRRASSVQANARPSANFNQSLPNLPGPPGRLQQQGGERLSGNLSGNQIHDQLFQHYQMLQAQEAQLRIHMRQRQQANLHAAVTAQLPPIALPLSAYPPQGSFEDSRRQSAVEQGPLSAPLRPPMQHNFYPVSIMSPSQSSSRSPQPSTSSQSTTNPPSPSISSSQPLNGEPRRSMQRSTTSGMVTWSTRSQSQPPSNAGNNTRQGPRPGRPLAIPALNPSIHGRGPGYPTLQEYQQAYRQAKQSGDGQQMKLSPQTVPVLQHSQAHAQSPRMGPMIVDGSDEGLTPRQYVGYYVDSHHQPRTDTEALIPPIPSYHDLLHRNRRASASPNLSRMGPSSSRSPSPSHSYTTRDNAAHSVGTNVLSLTPSTTTHPVRVPDSNSSSRAGPVIVDGSSDASEYATPPESGFISIGQSEAASLSDEHNIDTPSSTSVATAQDQPEVFALDPGPEHRHTNSTANILQFGDFPARTTGRNRPSSQIHEKQSSEPNNSMQTRTARSPVNEQSSGLGIDFSSLVLTNTTKSGKPQKPGTIKTSETPLSGSVNDPSSSTNQEQNPVLAPLLSPVREVRTPSPTTTRNDSIVSLDTPKAVSGSHARTSSGLKKEVTSSSLAQAPKPEKGKQKTEEVPSAPSQAPTANGTSRIEAYGAKSAVKASNEESGACSPTGQVPAQTSGWFSVASKKKKNRKSSSIGSATLLHEQGERKGG